MTHCSHLFYFQTGSPYDLTATGEEPMKGVQLQHRESPQNAAPVTKPAVQSPSESLRQAGLFKHGFQPKPETPKTSTEKGMTLVPSETSPAARPKIDAPQPRRVSFTTLSSSSKGKSSVSLQSYRIPTVRESSVFHHSYRIPSRLS